MTLQGFPIRRWSCSSAPPAPASRPGPRARYREQEIVSSDALRGVVGSGRHDLDASADAFRLLDQIVAARARRGLTCVVDTLGLEPERRRGYLAWPRRRAAAVAVVFDDAAGVVPRAQRGPRPAGAGAGARAQLRRAAVVLGELEDEGWDQVRRRARRASSAAQPAPARAPDACAAPPGGLDFVLQISRFPWGEDPAGWLRGMALAADARRLRGRRPDGPPDPDPAGGPGLGADPGAVGDARAARRRSTPGCGSARSCSPVTFRRARHHREGGRHPGRAERRPGVPAGSAPAGGSASTPRSACRSRPPQRAARRPGARDRDDAGAVGAGHQGVRRRAGHAARDHLLPAAGRRDPDHRGRRRRAPDAADRRPAGATRCNLRVGPRRARRKIAVLRRHCDDVGRDPAEVAVTVLDLPVVGRDRDDVWARVERLRGRTAAATFAARHHAGT